MVLDAMRGAGLNLPDFCLYVEVHEYPSDDLPDYIRSAGNVPVMVLSGPMAVRAFRSLLMHYARIG